MSTDSEGEQLKTDLRELVGSVHRRAMIVVIGLAASIVAYAVIGMIILWSRPEAEQGRLSPTFLVAVVFLTIAPIWVRRTQLAEPRLQTVVAGRGLEGLLRHFFVVTIVCAAFADLIGVLGLVAALTGGGGRYLLIFTAVALLVLARSYPSRKVWEQAATHFSARTQ